MKPKILIMLLMLVVPAYTSSVDAETRIYKDASSLGMGGVGVSTIGYQNSVIRNPANLGLMADHDIAPFFSIGMYVNNHVSDLFGNLYSGVGMGLDSIDYDSLINQVPSVGFNGPLNLGYMSHGFGIWTTSSIDNVIGITQNSALSNVSLNTLVDSVGDIEDVFNNNDLGTEAGRDSAIEDLYDILNGSMTTAEIDKLINDFTPEKDGELDYTDIDVTELVKSLIPLAQLVSTAEVTINVAYGYRIPFAALDDVSGLSMGATIRFAQRYKITTGKEAKAIDEVADDLKIVDDNLYHAGSFSSDFGMSLRLENFILAATVRDALSSEFTWKNFNSSEVLGYSKIPMSVDFGASYRFYFDSNWLQEVGMYVEIEDAMNDCTTWANKLRLGQELKLFRFLDVRVGMYKEFVTGGIGMGWKWFRVDFAYYREKYFNIFESDQYYLNMTVGLDNSPQRKERSLAKQFEQDRIQTQNLSFISQSLDGV